MSFDELISQFDNVLPPEMAAVASDMINRGKVSVPDVQDLVAHYEAEAAANPNGIPASIQQHMRSIIKLPEPTNQTGRMKLSSWFHEIGTNPPWYGFEPIHWHILADMGLAPDMPGELGFSMRWAQGSLPIIHQQLVQNGFLTRDGHLTPAASEFFATMTGNATFTLTAMIMLNGEAHDFSQIPSTINAPFGKFDITNVMNPIPQIPVRIGVNDRRVWWAVRVVDQRGASVIKFDWINREEDSNAIHDAVIVLFSIINPDHDLETETIEYDVHVPDSVAYRLSPRMTKNMSVQDIKSMPADKLSTLTALELKQMGVEARDAMFAEREQMLTDSLQGWGLSGVDMDLMNKLASQPTYATVNCALGFPGVPTETLTSIGLTIRVSEDGHMVASYHDKDPDTPSMVFTQADVKHVTDAIRTIKTNISG